MGKGRRRRNGRRSGGHPAHGDSSALTVDNVVSLRPDQLRALADSGDHTPTLGRRTPQPKIDRWSRHTFGDLGPAELIQILKNAKEGRTEKLADLWLHMLQTDSHLRSVWDTIMAPVYSARWEVVPADVSISEDDPVAAAQSQALAESAQDAAKACEEALEGVRSLSRTMSAMLDAVGLGYAVVEIVWGRGTLLGQPAWVPVSLDPVHGRRFAFSDDFEVGLYDSGRAVAELRERGEDVDPLDGRGRQLARLPAGKYMVHQPVTVHDYPTSTGLVFALSRPWLLKQIGQRYYAAGAERFAMPWVVGHMGEQPAGMTMDEFHDGLEGLSGQGVMVTRGETSVEILDTKGQSGADVWERFLRYQDAAMSKAVLGSTLNVEIGSTGGNRAAAESQADETITPRQEQHAEQLWATIQRDLFRYIVKYNPHMFPPSTPLPMGRSVLAEDPVEVDDLVIQSGYLKVNQLLESRGLPPLPGEQGEAFLKPPQPSAPFRAPTSEREADDRDPFDRSPWDEASRALSRALSTGRAPTSSR